ncbi:PREDICTED: Fc receptor-like protein 3 [Elephantulus edwardii]|uniref:Fc receptor-like protein 3 n=1 Tax=Elephantulus edwardii TaxID=28737 RepID=UPI0003F0782A|nr:PREDICTED: Fc receptor-like protein 3 [Elephantulus edwardii]
MNSQNDPEKRGYFDHAIRSNPPQRYYDTMLAPKAVILVQPRWFPVFEGDIVTLTCKGSSSSALGDTSWYYEESLLGVKSEQIKARYPGKYKCKTRESSLSDPLHVEFSSDWLILQALHPIFEGEYVNITCRGKKDNEIIERFYYKDGQELDIFENQKFIKLYSVSGDNSKYSCAASKKKWWSPKKMTHSKPLQIQVQELFLTPELTASPPNPVEGRPVTLKCETQLSPQRSNIELQFCFFREGQTFGKGWSRVPELQIPAMWGEDSGSYWCEAQAVISGIRKRSLSLQIRIPVSAVNLEILPPGRQVVEGEDLVLVCSVANGTGTITFSWHKEGSISLGRKTERSSWAELQIPAVKESDSGRYYCTADNSHGPVLSKWVRVTVRVPVSRPVLTLRTPRIQAVVGDIMELHCETQRGSPPILYQFYREDVILGNSSGPSKGVSLNISLTLEHSGNYSCEANNDLKAQRSHRVMLNVIDPVSRPVLTFRDPWAAAGDVVELYCEAQKGSPPILYQFYQENVTLGESVALYAGRATFRLFLTTEHSGNYFCEASNGLEAQRSEVVTLSVVGSSRNRTGSITSGVIGGLLSVLGLAAALLFCFRTQRKSGGIVATGISRSNEFPEVSLSRLSDTNPREPSYSESLGSEEMHPVYSNVNPADSNLLYSEIVSIQHIKGNSVLANLWLPENLLYGLRKLTFFLVFSKFFVQSEELRVIYSELKKAHQENSPGQVNSRERDNEDATDNYENVSCKS